MKLPFFKYQATGNDFIVLDGSIVSGEHLTSEVIALLCDRRFGIGADGLILLQESHDADFKMTYFNSDGNQGSFCGNGSRAAIACAKTIGIVNDSRIRFESYDGIHSARIVGQEISVEMKDVLGIINEDGISKLNTGSPHLVFEKDNARVLDLKEFAEKVFSSKDFLQDEWNVNVCKNEKNILFVRTYERGVCAETLSCGTGVVACALACSLNIPNGLHSQKINTRGGSLVVSFDKNATGWSNIWLTGPAIKVFEGIYDYEK